MNGRAQGGEPEGDMLSQDRGRENLGRACGAVMTAPDLYHRIFAV